MKFSAALLSLVALVAAAPASADVSPEAENAVPSEAILGSVTLPDEVIALYSNETSQLVFLNNTILEEAKADASLSKRDAKVHWGWVWLRPGEPFFKRDAEADADAKTHWGWVWLRPGEPFFKRDAEAEADAKTHWGWVWLRPGEPFF